MAQFRLGSATALLKELENDDDVWEEYMEEEEEYRAFLMLEDEWYYDAEDVDAGDKKTTTSRAEPINSVLPKTTTYSISVTDLPNACSICTMDYDDDEVIEERLDCCHGFCRECLAKYIDISTGDYTQLFHYSSKLIRVKEGVLSVTPVTVKFGVKCPAFKCQHIIEYPVIKRLAAPNVVERFERFTLRYALEQLDWLQPCPRGCGGYIQDSSCIKCTTPECTKKALPRVYKRYSALKCSTRLYTAHADAFFACWLQTANVRCCPNCHVIIEKNGGCDSHYCTRCKHSYYWSKSPTVSEGKSWFKMPKQHIIKRVKKFIK